MEVSTFRTPLDDASAVGEVRRLAVDLAQEAGFNQTDAGRVALIVTEAGSNLVKHAGAGEILLAVDGDTDAPAIDVLALDRGPGIADMGEALRDGFSSAGTPGSGLGAIARLASCFDLYSRAGTGTAVYARVAAGAKKPGGDLVIAGINVPYPGESVSGDGWSFKRGPSGAAILLADGLGHGLHAHEAADAAVASFHSRVSSPAEHVARIHDALRSTRGAAIAVAEIDRPGATVRFAGIGNISGTIATGDATRSVVSHHGTAGHDARRIQEFSYPWEAAATLVLHSDGLMTRWTFAGYPGLSERHPMVIAGVLYRDFCRGRDDVTIVVAREMA